MNDSYVVTLETPAAIVEKDARRSDVVRQRLQQIESSHTLDEFEQADLWAECKENNYWNDWKFLSFDDYLKHSGCDYSKREVYYRIQVSAVSKLLGVGKLALAKAKMSKLKKIMELDPKATVLDAATQQEEKMSDIMVSLINDAPNKSLKEIAEIVKRLKGETEEPESELTWMNLPVRRDAKGVVTGAIDLAVKQSGQTVDVMTKEVRDISQAVALETICGDYLADPNNQVDEFDNDVDAGDEPEDDVEYEDEDNDDFEEEDDDE